MRFDLINRLPQFMRDVVQTHPDHQGTPNMMTHDDIPLQGVHPPMGAVVPESSTKRLGFNGQYCPFGRS
jgi:hypothetical protein